MAPYDPQWLGRLRSLLADHSTNASSQAAYDALVRAVDSYLASRPLADQSGRSRPSVAEARQATTRLRKQLQKAQDALADLPINALSAFTNELGEPRGAAVRQLDRFIAAAERTEASLQAQPDKPSDDDRVVLAHDVALVIEHYLGRRPAVTRPKTNVTGARGGGLYAQILDLTLKIAGIPSADLGALMDRARRLRDDPDVPHNPP